MHLLDLVKAIGGPGSTGLLLVLLSVGMAGRSLATKPIWRRCWSLLLAAITASYFVLALPVTAHALADRLPIVASPGAEDIAEIQTLFILGGDNPEGRASAAVRVAASSQVERGWVLGSEGILVDLVLAGYPARLIREDNHAGNTSAQIDQVRALTPAGSGKPALVVSRLHAPRVSALASAADLESIIVPAPLDHEPPRVGWGRFVPSYGALMASRDAIYELAALLYYRDRLRR